MWRRVSSLSGGTIIGRKSYTRAAEMLPIKLPCPGEYPRSSRVTAACPLVTSQKNRCVHTRPRRGSVGFPRGSELDFNVKDVGIRVDDVLNARFLRRARTLVLCD